MVLFIEILLIGVGLSMDAFAVSICKGLGMTKVNRKQALTIGLYFGGFQALMPFIGYMLGIRFEKYITSIDHWIAFILLGFIGGKMVYEAVKEKDDDAVVEKDLALNQGEMLLLAIATSIDALAVGIMFAFTYDSLNIYWAIAIIGLTTFVLSIVGVIVGNFFGLCVFGKGRRPVRGGQLKRGKALQGAVTYHWTDNCCDGNLAT